MQKNKKMPESDISNFLEDIVLNPDRNEDQPREPSRPQDSADVKFLQACKINSHSGQIKSLNKCVQKSNEILQAMRQDTAVFWQASQIQNENIQRAFNEIKDLRKEASTNFQNLSQAMNVLQKSHREDRSSINSLKKIQEEKKKELNEFRQRVSDKVQSMEEDQSKVNDETEMRFMSNKIQFDAIKSQVNLIEKRMSAIEGQLKRKNQSDDELIRETQVQVETEVVDVPKKKRGRPSTKVNSAQNNDHVNPPANSSQSTSLSSAKSTDAAKTRRQKAVSLSLVPISNNIPGVIQSPTTSPVTKKMYQSLMLSRLECPQCKKVYTDKYFERHTITCKGPDSTRRSRSKHQGKHSMGTIQETESEHLSSASGKTGRVLRPRKNK